MQKVSKNWSGNCFCCFFSWLYLKLRKLPKSCFVIAVVSCVFTSFLFMHSYCFNCIVNVWDIFLKVCICMFPPLFTLFLQEYTIRYFFFIVLRNREDIFSGFSSLFFFGALFAHDLLQDNLYNIKFVKIFTHNGIPNKWRFSYTQTCSFSVEGTYLSIVLYFS